MNHAKVCFQTVNKVAFVLLLLFSCAHKPMEKDAEKQDIKQEGVVNETLEPASADASPLRQKKQVIHISGDLSAVTASPEITPIHISGAESQIPENRREETRGSAVGAGKQSRAGKTLLLSNRKITGNDQLLPELSKEVASRSVILNFDKADVVEILAMIAEVLEFDYILEPGVGGTVTIHTTEKIKATELFPVLRQILSSNGLAIVRAGRYYKITQMAEAQRKPVSTFLGKDGTPLPADDIPIIQLVPLKYLPAEAVQTVLTPLLTKTGSFLKIPTTNLLGIIDTGANIRRLLDIIRILDTDAFGEMEIKLFPVRFGKAEELNKELIEIFETVGLKEQNLFLKIVPIPRVNSILAVTVNRQYLKTIEEWIKKLDLPETGAGSMATYIYRVQNGDASNIASLIETLYRPKGTKKNQNSIGKNRGIKTPGQSVAKKRKVAIARPKRSKSVKISGATEIEGELQVVSDTATNSVIIRTNPVYYPIITETIRQLDIAPMQVMIEIMVAELTLDKNTQFGLEWAVRGGSAGYAVDSGSGLPGKLGDSFTNPSGVASYFIQDTGSILGLLSIKASESKLNILSSPVILTSENKEASISITNSVPISSVTTNNSGTTINSFEYTDAGIILKVTPRINSERFVSMDVYQEVSQVGEKPPRAATNEPPPIFKRIAQTSVVVKDRETLIIGGLIDSAERENRSRVPGLSKIPVIGKLFQSWTESGSKTELIILITPRVIESVSEGKKITASFRKRLDFLQYKINRKKSESDTTGTLW